MIKEAIEILTLKKNLTSEQMTLSMEEIMIGQVETPQIISFLTGLNEKGETVEELTAAASVMRMHVTHIRTSKQNVLDTCGTGGDSSGTFNISTAVAFVASACGITVAKHGNRSVSSRCGSADILEKLGVNINMSVQTIENCLDKLGIAFLFAQSLHPAMKNAMPARKAIGKRTMFNILGPLTNPAKATHQLMGVYDERWVESLALVLQNLGAKHALVVHGKDGLDEISTTDATIVAESYQGKTSVYEITPEDYGIKRVKIEDLKGGDSSVNARILLDIFSGKTGPHRDIVVLNAAAAIYAADKVCSIKEGIIRAEEAIDLGKAKEKVKELIELSNG